MTFPWRNLLVLALRLLKLPGAAEAEYRSSINRSYYAALGTAREYALGHGLQPRKKQPTHEEIWQHLRSGSGHLNSHHQAACKAIGDLGMYLRSLRYQADYDGSNTITSMDAVKAAGLADTITKRLSGLP